MARKENKLVIRSSAAEFLIFTNQAAEDGIEVRYEDDTVWLSQKMLMNLYEVSKATISEHLKNIFETGELDEVSTVRNFRTVQKEGNRQVTREIEYYNLDVIIAVGYRVNSKKATQFRRWATEVLKQFAIKGFVLDKERLKNGSLFGEDYFDELLEEIREIRASERRFYQKITDIYSTAMDYDKNATLTKEFFAMVQNKMHFAIHGFTAAELILERADSKKSHMGLMTWKKAPKGKIHKTDASIAKNYLNKEEIESLDRIVTMYLDYAEDQARRKIPMTMQDWVAKLDAFLRFNEREILDNLGKVSAFEKELSEILFERGVDSKGFASIRSKGDTVLFGGNTTKQMKTKLGVPDTRALADFLPAVTIKAKDLATEITNFGVKKDPKMKGEAKIAKEHIKSNQGNIKAEYGKELLINISKELKKYRKGFSRSNLQYMRLFYISFPKMPDASGKLTWSHYVEILGISNDLARSFYEKQCVLENWSVRELKRQKQSMLFERFALGKNKEEIIELSHRGQSIQKAEDIVKEPYILEFLGISEPYSYSELELEQKIIDNLQMFLLELGKGFTFVKRQFRISFDSRHHYIDLVFYHRILKCFVLIDLKIGEADHGDIGQMNMYLNYFKMEENTDGDNEPIGIILSAEKNDIKMEYAMGGISNQMFVSKYQLYLPKLEELELEIEKFLLNNEQ